MTDEKNCKTIHCHFGDLNLNVTEIDRWIETLYKCQYLPPAAVSKLCKMAEVILVEEKNVQMVNLPLTICGDIRGQFHDLLELFRTGGRIPETNYLFLGNYTLYNLSKSLYSLHYYTLCYGVETITLLIALKVRYPKRITLLRGDYDSRSFSQRNGFYEECLQKYGNATVWKLLTDLLDYLPIAAVLDKQVTTMFDIKMKLLIGNRSLQLFGTDILCSWWIVADD